MSNSSHVQPDLFGEFDRQQAERERRDQPATCPACGVEEPNDYLLRNNHGYNLDRPEGPAFSEHPIYGPMCTAQYLVTNHIIYDVITNSPESLTRDTRRGRELGLDVETIIEGARKDAEEKGINL